MCLAIEVLWIRLVGFAGMTAPQTFAFTLALFLLGIAIGALLGREICRTSKVDITSIGRIYLLAGITDILLIGLAIWLAV